MDKWEFIEVDFSEASHGHQPPDTFEKEGVTFGNMSKSPFRFIKVPNSSDMGLMFGNNGLRMILPWLADWALAKGGNAALPSLTFSVLAKGRQPMSATMTGPKGKHMGYVLEVTKDQFEGLRLKGGGGEGILIRLKIGRKI